jgi:anti-anti-sigma regulatory factor
MFRIQRSGTGQVVFTLSGRIGSEDLIELQQLLAKESETQGVVLDLKDVTLVNQDAVEFLARCEANSVQLRRCPAYIQKWMGHGKGGGRCA